VDRIPDAATLAARRKKPLPDGRGLVTGSFYRAAHVSKRCL
jgi:hypothetical protein